MGLVDARPVPIGRGGRGHLACADATRDVVRAGAFRPDNLVFRIRMTRRPRAAPRSFDADAWSPGATSGSTGFCPVSGRVARRSAFSRACRGNIEWPGNTTGARASTENRDDRSHNRRARVCANRDDRSGALPARLPGRGAQSNITAKQSMLSTCWRLSRRARRQAQPAGDALRVQMLDAIAATWQEIKHARAQSPREN